MSSLTAIVPHTSIQPRCPAHYTQTHRSIKKTPQQEERVIETGIF